MKIIEIIIFLLNLPYTLIGFMLAFLSVPISVKTHKEPFAIIFKVGSFKWKFWQARKPRAFAIGSTIVLGPTEEEHDLEHEIIHVRQHNKLPFIYPVFYYYETFRHGYRMNKYEDEAYKLSGSIYRGK